LQVPRGSATRPTADRVREALFSRLEHEGVVHGARVLDLYAGSGALGLEAASRGAAHVLLVESAAAAVAACRPNETAVGLGTVEVRASPVAAVLAGDPPLPYDLVLMDPPYDLPADALTAALTQLAAGGWLAEGAMVVVERSTRDAEPCWPPGLLRFDERRYGQTRLWFAEAPAPDEPA
jgi:16S rRNA (guanine966-N2)-methyltransferase